MSYAQPSIAGHDKQPFIPNTKGIIPISFKVPLSKPAVPRTVVSDASVLHLKWKNLDDFVKWKLEEERKFSVKFVSGLTHSSAQLYAQIMGSILYLCHRNVVTVAGKNSCPCFLRVQVPSDIGGVTAVYNSKHLHGKEGAQTNSEGTIARNDKGKKVCVFNYSLIQVRLLTHSSLACL